MSGAEGMSSLDRFFCFSGGYGEVGLEKDAGWYDYAILAKKGW